MNPKACTVDDEACTFTGLLNKTCDILRLWYAPDAPRRSHCTSFVWYLCTIGYL